jgi:hypothetical protein
MRTRRVPMHNIIPRLLQTPTQLRRPAPQLGEHTAEILSQLGLDSAAIDALAGEGIIRLGGERRTTLFRCGGLGCLSRSSNAALVDGARAVAPTRSSAISKRVRRLRKRGGRAPEAAEIVSRGGADLIVRINRALGLAVRDIEAVVGPPVLALAPPRTESSEHGRLLAEIIQSGVK